MRRNNMEMKGEMKSENKVDPKMYQANLQSKFGAEGEGGGLVVQWVNSAIHFEKM